MKKTSNKYGIRSFSKQFPNDEACLKFIFDTLHTHKCSCGGTYNPLFQTLGGVLEGRKQYQCSKCRFQIAPTAGTIFEKSVTPLTLWFHAILVFSNAKSGISAKQMQRELEVTYKCAYRILSLIRQSLKQDTTLLKGDVEVDVGFFGGKGYGGEYNKYQKANIAKKARVMVAVERGGKIRTKVVPDATADTTQKFIQENVATKLTSLITDSSKAYIRSSKTHDRFAVDHSKGEYVREDIHINTVETFFAHLKRSINGTFKSVSKAKLQTYLDSFVFHYNNRHSDKARFEALLGALLQPVA